ncbi:MAG: YkgJ family cysteine cluster protein [Desulfuromonadales bacterium]|nr:YkgJ family cysteine cluster protein [Desulfuromonadales bacterium]
MKSSEILTLEAPPRPDLEVSCANCQACCCRLKVMLITETGVPEHFIERDKMGVETMAQLADGWCAALDRQTMKCTIYEVRPWVCREYEVGDYECLDDRAAGLIR